MKTKWNLTANEERVHLANLERLLNAGVDVSEQKPVAQPMLRIRQKLASPIDNLLMAPPKGGYVIAVWLEIVALKAGVAIRGCEIQPQRWNDERIELVPYSARQQGYHNIAKLEYETEHVLNGQIEEERVLRRGDILRGVLLAQSFTKLPDWCCREFSVNVDLCFFDQFDNDYQLEVVLGVIRDDKPHQGNKQSLRADMDGRVSSLGKSHVSGETHVKR
jgi:hypothetical protein